jgi:cytochrome b involved in lipid metabolism
MPTYKTLLGGVAIIILVLAGSYMLLQSGDEVSEIEYKAVAQNDGAESPSTNSNVLETDVVNELPQDTALTATPDVSTNETVTTTPVTKPVAVNTTPTPSPTKTSTPTPTPTPTPQPTPAPKPTGYTLAEVKTHNSNTSCWTAVNGSVYDVTTYIKKHPGGAARIIKICGTDGTKAFEGQHGGESKPERTLEGYRIGDLI